MSERIKFKVVVGYILEESFSDQYTFEDFKNDDPDSQWDIIGDLTAMEPPHSVKIVKLTK